MRVYKTVSLRPETLRALESVFEDIDTINFSALADIAIGKYVSNMKTRNL